MSKSSYYCTYYEECITSLFKTAFISTDGKEMIECLSYSRNPETLHNTRTDSVLIAQGNVATIIPSAYDLQLDWSEKGTAGKYADHLSHWKEAKVNSLLY